jgi:transposase
VESMAIREFGLTRFAVGGAIGAGMTYNPDRSRGRMSRQRKTAAVLRMLRGEDIKAVAQGLGADSVTLSGWRDAFLAAGEAALTGKTPSTKQPDSDDLKTRAEAQLIKRGLLHAMVAVLEADGPQRPRRARPSDEEDQARIEAIRMMIAAQISILHRHYEATCNPLFVWKAIRLFAEWQLEGPLPVWMMAYLASAAEKLVNMAEGVDWTTAPCPPPTGADRETVLKFGRRYSEWSQTQTLDFAKAPGLALKALGFSVARGRNVFSSYRKTLENQTSAWLWAAEMEKLRRAKRAGVPPQALANMRRRMEVEDVSNLRKQIKQGQRSLQLGRVEPEPIGPLHARQMEWMLRNKSP